MTTITQDRDRLFKLLPSLYRIADADRGGELQALLALITGEADALHADVQQLWDDFFVETCQRWVIPYIGDLVGTTPLHDLDLSAAAATAESLFTDLAGSLLNPPNLEPPGAIPTRADVAKTIYYRRRKGTPPMLEELARDVTGWGAHVVEFFTLLDWNQHLEHVRLDAPGCPDVRRVDVGDRVGGPWDSTAHTVDVRRINEWDGWYNIANIGFFLWRLHAYRLTAVTPRPVGGTTWRRTFSPLGQDNPLFSAGRREPGESRLANELTVETPIRASAFSGDLRAIAAPPPLTYSTAYYGDPQNTTASFVVLANGAPVPANDIECRNLGGWAAFAQPAGAKIGVDVTRGRLIVPSGRPAGEQLTVSYYYGFSAAMGGGEYDRRKWIVPSASSLQVAGGGTALQTALASPTRQAGRTTVITIKDDATYVLSTDITLLTGETLVIQALDKTRAHVRLAGGSIQVLSSGAGGALTIGGLLVEGGLLVNGDVDTLRLLHTTLVPGRSVEQEAAAPPTGPSLLVASSAAGRTINATLKIQVAFSIVGALRIPPRIGKLWLLDSIVDGVLAGNGPAGDAISDGGAPPSGPPAHIERSTVLGSARFLKLDVASESIFTGTVAVDERQQGCVRFSFVPRGSKTPQQYRCQPELEIATEAEKQHVPPSSVAAGIAAWLQPSFEAVQYGRPTFAQLSRACPIQIRTGAEDGSEMGAFSTLKQPQRESNLRTRLGEYLPVGLEAGLIYVT